MHLNVSFNCTVLKRLYGKDAFPSNYSTTLTSIGFAGTVVGMLTFGYISDKIGRKSGMVSIISAHVRSNALWRVANQMLATGIVFLFSALSAAAKGAGGSTHGMLAMLIAMRFFLGIGIGAEYPCGSVSASEQSEEEGIAKNAQHRWFALATNSMIDFGFVVSSFTPLVCLWMWVRWILFEWSLISCVFSFGESHLRAVWRVAVGLGVVPAAAVFLWRLRMEEPTRYKQDSMKRVKIPYLLIFKRYWKGLAALCITWFIYDFITYPFGLYSSTVVSKWVLVIILLSYSSLMIELAWHTVRTPWPSCSAGA